MGISQSIRPVSPFDDLNENIQEDEEEDQCKIQEIHDKTFTVADFYVHRIDAIL